MFGNSVFGKTMENIRNRDIKLVVNVRKMSHLVAVPNYHMTKWFSKKLLAIEINKTEVKMNKPVYLGLLVVCIKQDSNT